MAEVTLSDVVAARESLRDDAARTLPLPIVLEWMRSSALDVSGAVYATVSNPEYAERIRPAVPAAARDAFLMKYFERCLIENPEGPWVDSRYGAAWDIASWIGSHWRRHRDRRHVRAWKRWLSDLYRRVDEPIREAMVNGALEHLFEEPEIARQFADWDDEPLMQHAYRRALEWRNKGGRTPLVKGAP